MIRLATKNDIEQILLLLREVLEVHSEGRPDIFKSGTTKYSREELSDIIQDPTTPVYVYDDGEVKGYAFCVIGVQKETNVLRPYKYLYIDDLCVKSTCRGKGIGKALYLYVKGEAKRFNCTRVTLNVWNLNQNAIAFYEALGLTPLKTTMEDIL